MAEKLWWQGPEATGYIVPTVRKKQEMNACVQIINSFLRSLVLSLWKSADQTEGVSSNLKIWKFGKPGKFLIDLTRVWSL